MPKRKTIPKSQRAWKSSAPTRANEAMNRDLANYVTTKKAAEILGVDPSHASYLVKTGKLKGIKLGHDWIVFVPSIGKYSMTKSAKGRPPGQSLARVEGK